MLVVAWNLLRLVDCAQSSAECWQSFPAELHCQQQNVPGEGLSLLSRPLAVSACVDRLPTPDICNLQHYLCEVLALNVSRAQVLLARNKRDRIIESGFCCCALQSEVMLWDSLPVCHCKLELLLLQHNCHAGLGSIAPMQFRILICPRQGSGWICIAN